MQAGTDEREDRAPRAEAGLTRRTPPGYRRRLRAEGSFLALSGLIGTLVLLASTSESREGPTSTIVQLAIVAVLLAWLGPRTVHSAIAGAQPLFTPNLGSGEPTPLWQLPLIVAALTVLVGRFAGWDAGLRVTLGCVLVGLAQAFLLARIVEFNERASGRRYFRVRGSRILRGTKLGYTLDS